MSADTTLADLGLLGEAQEKALSSTPAQWESWWFAQPFADRVTICLYAQKALREQSRVPPGYNGIMPMAQWYHPDAAHRLQGPLREVALLQGASA